MKQLKKVLRSALDAAGYTGFNTRSPHGSARDGLFTTHRDHFRRDPAFRAAYARGVPASQGVAPSAWSGAFTLLCGRPQLHRA
jgi:hypothetical protein